MEKLSLLRISEYASNWWRLVIIWIGKNPLRYRLKPFLMLSKVRSKALIGLAQTGPGKTGAFAIPILQSLLENPQPFFACVLSPYKGTCNSDCQTVRSFGLWYWCQVCCACWRSGQCAKKHWPWKETTYCRSHS